VLHFLGIILLGLIAGYAARFLMPGRHQLGLLKTIGLGIIGSFIGGWIGYVVFDHDLLEGALQTSGILGSIVGALIALFAYDKLRN
jgi:uncharacterized membrane protein YeaQ/YmgE (transglycosylase-associated protein family)